VLARYMQILSPATSSTRMRGAGHQHPPLVPAGVRRRRPVRPAFERGVKIIGATAHYATEDLDEGPDHRAGRRARLARDARDDLVRLGREVERSVLARAVQWHIEDRVFVHGNRTVVFR
jgi:formyltetrahydrofolate deformylase